jgi:hypothetical protein
MSELRGQEPSLEMDLNNPDEPSFEQGESVEEKLRKVRAQIEELHSQVESNGNRWSSEDGKRLQELEEQQNELEKMLLK